MPVAGPAYVSIETAELHILYIVNLQTANYELGGGDLYAEVL